MKTNTHEQTRSLKTTATSNKLPSSTVFMTTTLSCLFTEQLFVYICCQWIIIWTAENIVHYHLRSDISSFLITISTKKRQQVIFNFALSNWERSTSCKIYNNSHNGKVTLNVLKENNVFVATGKKLPDKLMQALHKKTVTNGKITPYMQPNVTKALTLLTNISAKSPTTQSSSLFFTNSLLTAAENTRYSLYHFTCWWHPSAIWQKDRTERWRQCT